MTAPRLTLRIHEVATSLGVNRSTVERWCASGRLTNVRVGGVVLIQPADLDAFLAQHREGRDVTPLRARARRTA